MADELRYAMSVTPILDNPGGEGETAHKAIDSRAARVGNSSTIFSDGNMPQTDGEDAYDADGILQHVTSGGASGNVGINEVYESNGFWIKNTGFKYDASKPGNIDRSEPEVTVIKLFLTGGQSSADLCSLTPRDSVFVPKPESDSISINDDESGNPVAVELVIYT